jgi:hypothetical protein
MMTLVAVVTAACSDEEPAESTGSAKQTAAQRFCEHVSDRVERCGAASPCDEAMVADCADVTGVLSDAYLDAATDCLEADGEIFGCLRASLGVVAPSDAHRAFAATFCSECLQGLPGCEGAFFSSDGSDASLAGKLVMPFGDSLVNELAATCASGLTCLATFTSCAQQVLVQRALPEQTATCFVDSLLAGSSASDGAPVSCGGGGAGAAGDTASGSGSSTGANSTSGDPGTTSSTGTGPTGCGAEADAQACLDCCLAQEPAALDVFALGVLNECGCYGTVCHDACAEHGCGGTELSAGCAECLDGAIAAGDQCAVYAWDNCAADADCAPLIACFRACPY